MHTSKFWENHAKIARMSSPGIVSLQSVVWMPAVCFLKWYSIFKHIYRTDCSLKRDSRGMASPAWVEVVATQLCLCRQNPGLCNSAGTTVIASLQKHRGFWCCSPHVWLRLRALFRAHRCEFWCYVFGWFCFSSKVLWGGTERVHF